jgi:hypothetical protein
MGRILTILISGLVLLIDNGSDRPGPFAGPGFIDITVESNLDRQYFQYNLNQRCIPVPGISDIVVKETPVIKIMVPVNDFKCTNRIAYKDFLFTLKASKYPWLEIAIPPYSEIKNVDGSSALLRDVLITVAGVAKHYDINCKLLESNSDHQVLNGSAVLKLTDFGIVPPVRFMGLVRVKDEITINFELCLMVIHKLSVSPVSW